VRNFDIIATKAGRRVEVNVGRTTVEVVEVTRTGQPVRSARFLASRVVAGLPNKVIAMELGISPRTVEVYRANLMTKMGVRSLSEALRVAFAAGLIATG